LRSLTLYSKMRRHSGRILECHRALDRSQPRHFKGARLTGVNFSGSNLRGATFENADLRGCNFSNTNMNLLFFCVPI